MSDQPEPAPFTFKPAAQKPTRTAEEIVNEANAIIGAKKRGRKPRDPQAEPTEKKTRKRRAKASSDVLVLKMCLRQLRTLDTADALRTIETLRILFK